MKRAYSPSYLKRIVSILAIYSMGTYVLYTDWKKRGLWKIKMGKRVKK